MKKNKGKETGLGWLILIIIGLLLAAPFLLDIFYGNGWLAFYPNHFSASEWFTFLGSYLPAVIFGIITYYNTVRVNRHDEELEALRSRHRYSIIKDATINRFGYESSEGKYYTETNKKFQEHTDYMTDNAYLAEFTIEDQRKRVDIENVSFISAEWLIYPPKQDCTERIVRPSILKGHAECSRGQGYSYDIKVFMICAIKNKDIIDRYFNNCVYQLDEYKKTDLYIIIKLDFQDNTSSDLRVHLVLTPNENNTIANAVNYSCVME